MKIAYVEVDSLLTKYRYWNDLNELMIQKEENIRTTLNEKAKELDGEMREFQRKLENNGFASRERAEQENARLLQKQRDLQQLQEKFYADLQAENQKNSLAGPRFYQLILESIQPEKRLQPDHQQHTVGQPVVCRQVTGYHTGNR